jgi:hypothetical protein
MAHPSKELFHIAGDVPDPTGTGLRGAASTLRLDQTAMGHPKIVYKDFLLEADIYSLPDAPMYVHLICPLCRHALKASQDNKALEYEPKRVPKIVAMLRDCGIDDGPYWGGTLSVERFECTWESDPEIRRDFGLAVCNWRVEIDNNIARDV